MCFNLCVYKCIFSADFLARVYSTALDRHHRNDLRRVLGLQSERAPQVMI